MAATNNTAMIIATFRLNFLLYIVSILSKIRFSETNMPIIIILVIALSIYIKVVTRKGDRNTKEQRDTFWEREHKANFTRSQDISGLDYITIPFSDLPFSESTPDSEIRQVERRLRKLDGQLIIDLSAYTNTELKLEFGAPNFTKLSTADQNYTILIRSLDKWGQLLINDNRPEDAEKVLKYAIECKTVIGSTYKTLASLYAASERKDEINKLIDIVSSLDFPTAKSVLDTLRSIL